MDRVRVGLLVPAAGRGERLGREGPKAFVVLCGEPIVLHALRRLATGPPVVRAVVTVPQSHLCAFRDLVRGMNWPFPIEGVAGGAERQESVRRGLDALGDDVDLVVVHDAVRPLVSSALLTRCVEAARLHGAALAAVPVQDTLKRVAGDVVVSTVNRRGLWLAQTPQAFRLAVLREAHRRAAEIGYDATDDAALVEWAGTAPRIVPGDPENVKITVPRDLQHAERMILGTSSR